VYGCQFLSLFFKFGFATGFLRRNLSFEDNVAIETVVDEV